MANHHLNQCWLVYWRIYVSLGLNELKQAALWLTLYHFDLLCYFVVCSNYTTVAVPIKSPLTHWGRVTHICLINSTIIGSDNGLAPSRRQAIIWTNAGILLIRTLGTIFSEISSKIHTLSYSKMHFKMSSAKRRPFCPGLGALIMRVKSNKTDKVKTECIILELYISHSLQILEKRSRCVGQMCVWLDVWHRLNEIVIKELCSFGMRPKLWFYHTRPCAYQWMCVQVMWNAQVKGQVTETHRS